MASTMAKGTPIYMAPELKAIIEGTSQGIGEFIPELADVFSLGITFLRFTLYLNEK